MKKSYSGLELLDIVKILSYFQEELMIQENPNKLEKKMIAWREEKK